MKVIVVLTLSFAVCATASVFKRQLGIPDAADFCMDEAATMYISESLESFCSNSSTPDAQLCGDTCAGNLCNFYTNNGYSTICAAHVASSCLNDAITPPESCLRCTDATAYEFFLNLPASCNPTDFNPQDFCNDECAGAACTYLRDNDYPDDCLTSLGQICTDAGLTAPAVCMPSPPFDFDAVCMDAAATAFIDENAASCSNPNRTLTQYCGEDCVGSVCSYYTANDYSAFCTVLIAAGCLVGDITPATSCLRCINANLFAMYLNLPASCNAGIFNPQDFCNDDCAGVICTAHRDGGFPDDCRGTFREWCEEAGLTVPTACGALALVTMKEVAAVILLVAAFFIF